MPATAARVRVLTGGKVLAILLAFFGTVIAVNMTLTVLAVETLSGTVVGSAYNASLAYQNEIEAAHRQDARHWNVAASATRGTADNLNVRVEARNERGEPITGLQFSVRLQRPVDTRFDRDAPLSANGAGVYGAQFTGVAAGQWDLLIEANASGETLFQSKNRIWLD